MKRLAIAIVLGVALVVPAQPYHKKAQEPQKEKEQRQELQKKTLALLNDTASAALSLKLPENRIFVLTHAADLLWAFDQKRARSLYWDAINSLNLIAPSVRHSGEKLSKEEQLKIIQAYAAVYGLRLNILRQVAKQDLQMALEMLRATRQVAPRDLRLQYSLPDDHQLEQEIATEVAARDPARALQLARESLRKGLTVELLNLIRQLTEKNPEKATEFAGEVIAKLRVTNVATNFRASTVAVQLLLFSRMPDPTGPFTPLGSTARIIRLSDDQKRDLVELVTSAALSASANSNLLFDLSGVMPEIEQFFPERLAPLEQKLATFNQTLTKKQRIHKAFSELIRRGDPEEIVRTAANESEHERLALYELAAMSAAARGDTDSFRELVSKEVKDEGEQRKIIDVLDAEQIDLAAHRKDIDELRKLLPKIRRKEERARAMVETALLLKEKGEDAEAVTLLDEAAGLIKTDLKSETQTNALLTLLSAYALIDPPKGFAIAERTVDQANSQISMLLLVDRVVKSGTVKKSEIILDQAGLIPLDSLVFKYGKGLGALAVVDFNRTRALADRFERNELRLMARLLIVRGILNPETDEIY